MCGIAGKIKLKGAVDTKELLLLAEKIKHRGPDDMGTMLSEDRHLGFTNRRLAVIDLSINGHQPMNYLKRYWITYNGEIYNFQYEKDRLEKKGYKFKSNSDTEVVLALYDKYKNDCLEHLRGMYAFAIYDEKEKIIFIARDRIGKKPLKYYFDGNVFIFASELKSILTQKEVKKSPDWQAINDYLTFGFVPSPKTGFDGIYKLEPGHYLIFDIKKGTLINKKYWAPDFNQKIHVSEDEWCKKIIDTLEESTKLRLISDVPVGALLSGGVDSSGVVATMARLSAKPIKTFTITYKEKGYDERDYAKKISKIYNTEHTELLAEPTSVDILPKLVYQYEEPFADASNIVTYMVSKLAKKYVTVVLNGDGGDENFAGYDRYCRLKRDVALDSFEWLLRPLGMPFFSYFAEKNSNLSIRALKFLKKSRLPLADRFITYNCYLLNEDKDNLYTNEFRKIIKNRNSYEIERRKFEESKAIDPRDKALYADLTLYFPDTLLVKMDIASMSVSLEARSPFLDHKMIELAAQIPFDLKVKGWCEFKYILKKALEKYVPKENLYRKKRGFSIPLSTWFTGSLNSYARSQLLSKNSKTKSVFKTKKIKEMLELHSEENDFAPKLWAMLCLELWLKEFF